jgi:protein arginine kinase activator
MLCQICGKNPATVHYTEAHDNKMSEIHVCENCAEEKGFQQSAKQHQFDIGELLAGMVDTMTSTEE